MFIKLASYLFAFSIINKESFAAEEGMPQLNPEYWVSQIFWLIITFSFLYIFLSKIILPKISETLEKRKLQISDNLEQAEKYKEDTQKKISGAEKEIKELKKNSIENINKIAIEVSTDLVKTIMNIELNKSNVSAIVDDVSKKKVDKHLW